MLSYAYYFFNFGVFAILTAAATDKMRHERKYLLDKDTAFLLKQRLSYVLKPDSAAPGGQYKVSSLYFDDMHGTAFFEKRNGLLNREKMRARYYNGDTTKVQLERKIKHGDMVVKQRAPLAPGQYDMMRGGDYNFISENSFSLMQAHPVLERFYALHLVKCMRPVVVVTYNRQAYMHPLGNVRVTFDSDLTATAPGASHSFAAMPGDNIVLEIKYDNFLPSFIEGLFSGFQLTQRLAISKFVMAKMALQGL